MYALIRLPIAAFSIMVSSVASTGKVSEYKVVPFSISENRESMSAAIASKYNNWQLDKAGISFQLFSNAMQGYQRLLEMGRINNAAVISIADFSKPSTEKRLYIINTETGELLFKTWVAHGRNSGKEQAVKFSNAASSLASSPGFYITADTYTGKHGYSLRLQGCEKGINDHAYQRSIVVHGADYVSADFIRENGFLGRSHGCPAVAPELAEPIINEIKNGSCFFIYAPLKKYLQHSALLKG